MVLRQSRSVISPTVSLGNDTTTKIRGDNYPDTGGMGRNKENHYDF